MKKVVVIGSNGLLGQTLSEKLFAHPEYKIYAMAAGGNRNPLLPDERYFALDIRNMKSIKWQLNLIQPDFVINALAMTRVDYCEENKEECTEVNVHFVSALADVCADLDTHLIHISTDFVFDGKRGLYRETDAVNPINHYGLTKVQSEKIVREKCNRHTIIRTILVYGIVAGMKKSNLVLWATEMLRQGKKINIVTDQFRMPTYVGNLAEACLLAMEKQATGTYHISGNDLMSIYEMVKRTALHYGLDTDLIIPVTSGQLNQIAPRPPQTGFMLDKATVELGFEPLGFPGGLAVFDKERKKWK